MNIIEALNSRKERKEAYITRKSWNELYVFKDMGASCAIKLLPTNSPDCCVLVGVNEKAPRQRWQPTAEDLVADDWITVS